jgi:LmbE family N-acetylglucosaminyl deacetylase
MKSTFKSLLTKVLLLGILLPVFLFFSLLVLSPSYFRARTKTLTFPQPVQRLLIVLAHPDDEVTNSGLIRYLADSGTEITLLTLSDGSANPQSDTAACSAFETVSDCRIAELKAAAELLGINKVVTPMLPDSALIHHMPQAIERISEEINSLRPDTILTMEPSGLNGQTDHRMLFPAVAKAIQNTKHSTQVLLSTLPWPISAVLPSKIPPRFEDNLRVFPTAEALRETKSKVAEAHKSQTKTIRGLTLGLGPSVLFRWLDFETYSVVESNDLKSLGDL